MFWALAGARSSIDDGARSDVGLDDETVEPDQGNGNCQPIFPTQTIE